MLTQNIAWPTFIYFVVKQRFSTRTKWHCYSTTPFKLWSSYCSWNTNDEEQLWEQQHQKSKIASNFLLLCCLIDTMSTVVILVMITTIQIPGWHLEVLGNFYSTDVCATKSDFLSSSTEVAWYWFGSMLQNFHTNLLQLQSSFSVFCVSHLNNLISCFLHLYWISPTLWN